MGHKGLFIFVVEVLITDHQPVNHPAFPYRSIQCTLTQLAVNSMNFSLPTTLSIGKMRLPPLPLKYEVVSPLSESQLTVFGRYICVQRSVCLKKQPSHDKNFPQLSIEAQGLKTIDR